MKLKALLDSALVRRFLKAPVAVGAAVLLGVIVICAALAPWIAPVNILDVGNLDVLDASLPPAWAARSDPRFLLGTDSQGRDILSAVLYGTRISLVVGVGSVVLAMAVGVVLGLFAGYAGGAIDGLVMRIADVQLAFPSILIALLVAGVARGLLPSDRYADAAVWVVVLSIGLSTWVHFARPVRAACMVEKGKDYVLAARLLALRPASVLFGHILPNVLGSVLVIATLGLGTAILIEASLSFLGVGMPPTAPSLGTLVSMGKDYIAAGEWWITFFPGMTVAVLVVSVNLVGDFLRDALNPRLRMSR